MEMRTFRCRGISSGVSRTRLTEFSLMKPKIQLFRPFVSGQSVWSESRTTKISKFQSMASSLKEDSAQNHMSHRKIDHETCDVDKCGNEGRRSCCWIKTQTLQ